MPDEPLAGQDPTRSASFSWRRDVPEAIGPFQILRTIGVGGMGIVFLAQQERPSRTVALKVIHGSVLSERTLRRFEHEAELLARLQHPGIAQVYQVGTYATPQGDLPYIAMEYVDGERLDDHVARRALSLRARLELAARIADAVEHAHQKGVIHRDLKPGNILVTAEGQPKILDFGVARLADDDTRTTTLRTDAGSLLGTLTYMSPEQASGAPHTIDTRADVYSLGVVLYELLTGKLPYPVDRVAVPEAVRVIREEEPTKLGSHDRALRGDIETIVRKALEKDPERRYPTAQALADDIRRHLADEPIQARPPSTWYQVSKFARRNKILVGGVVAVLLTLIGGVAVSTRLYLLERTASERERVAREAAEREESRASAAASFLLSLFSGLDPEVARGADTRLLQHILEGARGRLATELAGQPDVEAKIRGALGMAYVNLTLFDDAELELRRALELWQSWAGPDDRRTLDAEHALANLAKRRGELARAEEEQRATLERQARALGEDDRDTLRTRSALGDNLMRQRRLKEAEDVLREVLARQEELFGDGDDDVLATRMVLAQTLTFESKFQEARDLAEGVFLARSTELGDDHPHTITALGTLSGILRDQGAIDEAIAAQRDALERAQRVFGPDNQQTLSMLNNLSLDLAVAGDFEESERVLRDCLERRRRVFGDEHVETLNTLNHLAQFLWDQRRLEEVEPLIVEHLATCRRVLGEDHRETVSARHTAAMVLGSRREYRAAADHFAAVVERSRSTLGEDDPQFAQDLYNWAATLQNGGDHAAAEPILRECIELVAAHGFESQDFVPAAWNALAKALEARGEREEADLLFQDALDERRRRHGPVHAEVAYSLGDYGYTLLERGDAAQAEPLLAEFVRMRVLLSSEPWRIASAREAHGRCLLALGRHAEAEAELVPACEAFAGLPDAPQDEARRARATIRELYAAWEAAEPGQGISARAERWQAKFPAE
jgi:serine/threonine protein kinase/tetratricopeptide (TPR) repeat protein